MTFRAVIFTAKATETVAVKAQLIGPHAERKTHRHEVYTVWKIRKPGTDEPESIDLEIAFYETGKGQDQTAISCPAIVESFRPDVVIYLGCAGGEPETTNVGDVYVASQVWPYEKAKANYRTVKSRAHPIEPDRALLDQARAVKDFNQWRKRVPKGAPNEPEVLIEPIASGEKVIVHDDSQAWKHIKKNVDDHIAAVETEGHGFLASLVPLKTYALMIRGISDNLRGKNADGAAVDDDRQITATANATAFALQLLLSIDFSVLRQNKNQEAGAIDDDRAWVTMQFQATDAQLGTIVTTVSKLSNSEVIIRQIDTGSIVIVFAINRLSAAFLNALYQAGHIQHFFKVSIIGFASSAVRSHDPVFDKYLDLLQGKSREKDRGAVLRELARKFPDWSAHSRFVDRTIRKNKKLRHKDLLPKMPRMQRVSKTPPFSVELAHLLRQKEVSMKELADFAGVAASTVSRWAQGQITPHRLVEQKVLTWLRQLPSFDEFSSKR